jgi:hypothetical protein
MSVLQSKNMLYAVLTNSKQEMLELEELHGKVPIVLVDTVDKSVQMVPDIPIGKVFIFEESLPLTCRYLQAIKSWTAQPIYVITDSGMVRNMYKELGATYTIYSRNADVSFLLDLSAN